MKILQINCVYKKGSTGKITYDIHSELLERKIDSVVCYGRGKRVNETSVYKTSSEIYSKLNNIWSRITGIIYGGCFISTKILLRIIKKENPDIVHLQCVNGFFVNIYKIIDWLKKNNFRTVITLHAEFMYTGGCSFPLQCNQWMENEGCGYLAKCPRWREETKSLIFDGTNIMWKKMKKAFESFDENLVIVSVSPWLKERAKMSCILRGKDHRVVLNGLDTSIFHRYDVDDIIEELGIKNEKIICHVTPEFNLDPTHLKGGYYVNELAKRLKKKNVKIIVVGRCSSDIIISENIILLGEIKDQTKLAKIYNLSDITLITSKIETFSMVTAEGLCCGSSIVGFKAGGPEQIALSEYSKFVDYGDINDLEKAVCEMIARENNKEIISKEAVNKYGKQVMCDNYIKIYEELYREMWNK